MFWIGLYIMLSCLHEVAHKYAVSLQMMFHWQGMTCNASCVTTLSSRSKMWYSNYTNTTNQIIHENLTSKSPYFEISHVNQIQQDTNLLVQEHSQNLWLHLALRSEGNQGNEARSWEATNLHSVGLAVPTTTGRSVNSTPSKMIKRKVEDKKITITRCWRYHTHSQPLAHESHVRGCWRYRRYMVLP